jgi:DNA end-binding protein Ku
MARATWKGVLQISRVAIPIKVYPATEASATLSFNQLHASCQSRLQQKKWCPICAREVPSTEITKGFEFEAGKYVLLLEAELDAVQPPSTRVIDLVRFADADALDPIAIERSYYLGPDGPLAGEAFAVVSAALVGKVGIGKLAIYGREYLVAVRVQPELLPALVLQTLHHTAEMRPVDMIDEVPMGARVPLDQVRLCRQVIVALERPLNLSDFTDDYQADVRRIIDAKIAGHEILIPLVAAPPVVSLREALQQSLAAVSVGKKIQAKLATPAKRKRAS